MRGKQRIKKLGGFLKVGEDAKLSKKIGLQVGKVLVLMLFVLVLASTIMAGIALTNAIDGQLDGLATENGLKVQNELDAAASVAQSIQDYLTAQYENFETYIGKQKFSRVHVGKKLEAVNAEIENYILNTAWASINGNDYIASIAVMFEPNAFDPNIPEYSIGVTSENAKNKTAIKVGTYAEYGSKEYYKEAATTQKAIFSDAYAFEGTAVMTMAFPIVYGGETQGVIAVDIDISKFEQLDMTSEEYKSLYGNVITSEGIYIYDVAGLEWSGTDMQPYFAKQAEYEEMMQLMQGTEEFKLTTTREDGRKVVRYCYPIKAAEDIWWAQTIVNKSDMNKMSTGLVWIMIILSIVVIVVLLTVMVRIIRKLLKPMEGVVYAAEQLAVGNFDIELQADSKDEIGLLTEAFAETIAKLKAVINDLNRGMKQMAEGNFNIAPEVEYPGELKGIEEALGILIVKISETLSQIDMAAEQVAGGAEQVAAGAQSLTDGATDQASSIEELQATVTDVSGEVDRNAQNAETANDMAREVGVDINASNEQMQAMVEAMNAITEASNQINNIINTINDIASQTNLLALNASIEAARAGEMGKGFAVVAGEVGNLAAQSAEAAKTSTALIADAIQAVENGKGLADETAVKLAESAAKTQELVANIRTISEASVRQAEELEQVTRAVEQIAAVVEENTAMAEESSASSEEMSGQAQVLKELIEQFQLKK